MYLLIQSLQYVFNNGQMDLERLKHLVRIVGKERLVLDLSCRKKVQIVHSIFESELHLREKVMHGETRKKKYLKNRLSIQFTMLFRVFII